MLEAIVRYHLHATLDPSVQECLKEESLIPIGIVDRLNQKIDLGGNIALANNESIIDEPEIILVGLFAL